MAKKKLRPVGNIMLDMEELLEELSFAHDLQHYEVLALVHGWLQAHAPGGLEVYEDGTNPIMYYGPSKENK